ncbi:MAG TPA: nuclear transport factor 2 family protein [Actinomycetota bacterium]
MADHPNAELVRKGYDAFTAGDMEWMNTHLHENIVWHEPGSNVLSGDYHGREETLAHFAKSVQVAIPDFDIHDVVGNDDHAIALVNIRLERNDNHETFETRYVHIFHVDAQEVALESWIFYADQGALDAFLKGAE